MLRMDNRDLHSAVCRNLIDGLQAKQNCIAYNGKLSKNQLCDVTYRAHFDNSDIRYGN